MSLPTIRTTYALLTGASHGIGRALARTLASNGYNLLIVSRDENELTILKQALCQEFNVNIIVIACDLAHLASSQLIFDLIKQRQLSLEILVNNAGFGLWGDFINTAIEQENDMVNLHINQVLQLTKLFINYQNLYTPFKILNVSSVYAFSPVMKQSVYSATKMFQLCFTQALRAELNKLGAYVCCLCPGTTLTHFRKSLGHQEKPSWLSMTSEEVANIAYRGLMNNKAIIIPGLVNKFYVAFVRFLPVRFIGALIYKVRGLKIKS